MMEELYWEARCGGCGRAFRAHGPRGSEADGLPCPICRAVTRDIRVIDVTTYYGGEEQPEGELRTAWGFRMGP